MKKEISKKYSVWICSIVIFIVFNFSACGKKGPPRPPDHEKPHSIFNPIGLR
jgi:predicted small lipoprotein YifL